MRYNIGKLITFFKQIIQMRGKV